MAFSINDFRKKGMAAGGARPNLFSCQITSAPVASVTVDAFGFLCKIATIPASTLGVVEVPYFGRNVKVPGNRTFDNLSITVINDEDYGIRNGFENWMNSLNTHETNVSANLGNKDVGFIGQMTITHFKRDLNELGQWKFVNIFPVALGEIGLDWGSNDTIEEYTVDIAYDYWTHGLNTS